MNVHNMQSMDMTKNSHETDKRILNQRNLKIQYKNIYIYIHKYVSEYVYIIYYTSEVEARKKAKDSSKRWIWQKSAHIQSSSILPTQLRFIPAGSMVTVENMCGKQMTTDMVILCQICAHF